MKSFFYVFIGGGLGSLFRFAISKLISISKNEFPWSTFFANLIGCFLVGLLLGWAIKNNSQRSELYIFLVIGFSNTIATIISNVVTNIPIIDIFMGRGIELGILIFLIWVKLKLLRKSYDMVYKLFA